MLFQFESLAFNMDYEREYLEQKQKKVQTKLGSEGGVGPNLEKRTILKEVLESILKDTKENA